MNIDMIRAAATDADHSDECRVLRVVVKRESGAEIVHEFPPGWGVLPGLGGIVGRTTGKVPAPQPC